MTTPVNDLLHQAAHLTDAQRAELANRLASREKGTDIFYAVAEPPARFARSLLQLAIGGYLFWIVLLKMLWFTDLKDAPMMPAPEIWSLIHHVFSSRLLELISQALVASAAVELAYMLFTPGPDEAIDPLILGIAGSTLFALSDTSRASLAGSVFLDTAIVTLLFSLSLGGLLYVRHKCKSEWFRHEMNSGVAEPWRRIVASNSVGAVYLVIGVLIGIVLVVLAGSG